MSKWVQLTVRQDRPSRKLSGNSKLDAFFVTSFLGKKTSTTECPRQSVKIDMFFSTIDRMLAEFDRRFSDNIDVLRCTSVFNPSCDETFLQYELISTITQHYNKAGINTDSLQSQLDTAKSLLSSQSSRPKDIFAFRDILSSSPNAFSDVLKLVDIVLTMPVTTASNERMFSTLRRVKNYLRSSCGDERLSDLLVLSCLRKDAKDLDIWHVVENFARMKSRRYPLLH